MHELITELIDEHRQQVKYFEDSCLDELIKIFRVIEKTINSGHRIFLCGNGGSHADCQHVAAELVGRFRKNREPLPAVALSTDSSIVTCIGNDYSFEDIFSRQVVALTQPGDLLWAFSTSGHSRNILKAVESALRKGVMVIAFTGRKDNPLDQLADYSFCANSDKTNINQEMHQLAYHIICNLIDNNY